MSADPTRRGGSRWTVTALGVGMVSVLALTVAVLVSFITDPDGLGRGLTITWAFLMAFILASNTAYRVVRRQYDRISTVRRRFDMIGGSIGCAMALLLIAAMFVVGPALHDIAVFALMLAAGLSLLAEGRWAPRRVNRR